MTSNCANCEHARPRGGALECHRYAPRSVVFFDGAALEPVSTAKPPPPQMATWPQVPPEEWCYEWGLKQ